jgi:hypothetical protein
LLAEHRGNKTQAANFRQHALRVQEKEKLSEKE